MQSSSVSESICGSAVLSERSSTSLKTVMFSVDSRCVLATIATMPSSGSRCSIRCRRSSSTISTLAPQSVRPYSNSSLLHQPFSATLTAPSDMGAKNEITHSG